MSKNRFDLEQAILECWQLTSEINTLFEDVCEADYGKYDHDKIINILLGMRQLYDIKFRKLFDMYEDMISDGKIT